MTDGTFDPTLRRPSSGPPTADLPEGLEVGEYRVLRKIGEGGMGAVYAAIHPVIGKRIAIKVLAPHIAEHPELVRRFVDEARAVNKIGHPNIVDIFSFGWLPDQRHYFAMEYLEGMNLSDRMKQPQAIEIVEARRLLGHICGALEAAHQAGIVHRDLKPDNIWVAAPKHGDSFAKLLDFGIAKLMGEGESAPHTVTGAIMGTPAYMAPEQCRGIGVEPRTDIYALGVILYEFFAGRTPFQGSFVELITQHLTVVPEPPSVHRTIPPALERLILRCLEKDPGKRPASAAALGRELEAVLSGAPVPLRASSGDRSGAAPHRDAGVIVGAVPSASEGVPSPSPSPDTLSPPPGKTSPGATLVPAPTRIPRVWLGGAVVAVVGVVLVAVFARRGATPGPRDPPKAERKTAAGPPGAAPAAFGHVRVQAQNVDNARFFIDDRLVASGAGEADLPSVVPDRPHLLRIEADGLAPAERRFTVAAGGVVEIQMALTAAPSKRVTAPQPSPSPAIPAAGGAHPGHKNPPHARAPESRPPEPRPASPKAAHHRDGLVGDDIFDK